MCLVFSPTRIRYIIFKSYEGENVQNLAKLEKIIKILVWLLVWQIILHGLCIFHIIHPLIENILTQFSTEKKI